MPLPSALFDVRVSLGDLIDLRPTSIFATATPKDGKPLSEEAALLKYAGFDWIQKITATPMPPDITLACGDELCTYDKLVQLRPTWYDPPNRYGYQYCNPNDKLHYEGFDCTDTYPYYYRAADAEKLDSTACIHFENHDVHQPCIYFLTDGVASLNFYDAPQIRDVELGTEKFLTELVGIFPDGSPDESNPLYAFTWEDDYTAPNNDIRTLNYFSVDPGGTGGVTLTALDGVPVPEASSAQILGPGLLSLMFMVWRGSPRRKHNSASHVGSPCVRILQT